MPLRLPNPRGLTHPAARFRTADELEAVQQELECETKSLRELAREHGCSHATLSRIRRKISYRQK